MRILIVEDQADILRHVKRALERADHEVSVAIDGPEAVEVVRERRFDLIVLDLSLPGFDGMEVMKRISPMDARPRVLMLTARGEIDDRVKGLNAGADDYLTKPFDMKELLARVEALGRRVLPGVDDNILEAGDVVLDVIHRVATRNGDRIELSPREFSLLQVLIREPGRTFSRGELFERIWGREQTYEAKTVEIFVMRLRKKLDVPGKPSAIETVRGIGYKLAN
ncbi:response regulator receiver domain protein [Verrucomicrobiia bacterium DG1235]|nr:response regulator receiver domain protein [Verrucomicrobiae bacterium DG1235]